MKILNNLELISSKIKLGDKVLELPKKDGVIATLGDLSNSEQDVVFGKIESDSISTSCVFASENITSEGTVSAVCGYFGNIDIDETLCVKNVNAQSINIGDEPVATELYVQCSIYTLEGEVQDAVDELSAKISSVYKYVGSVETEAALKALDTTNLNNGDVYNVTATDENWALIKTETETKWDKLGSTIDLAPYALKSDVSGCIAAVEAKIPTDFYTTSQADAKFEKAGCADALENSLRLSIHTNSLDVCGTSETTFTVRERDVTRFLINTKDELIKTEYPIQYTGQDICISSNYCCSCCATPILVTDKAVIDYVEGQISTVEGKIPTDYLPGNNVAINTYLVPVTTHFTDVTTFRSRACFESCIPTIGIDLVDETDLSDTNLIHKKYLDNRISSVEDKIPTDFYTTSQADVKFDKSGCASWALNEAKTFASGCAKAVEDKIPTNYLPAENSTSGYIVSTPTFFSCTVSLYRNVVFCGEHETSFYHDVKFLEEVEASQPIKYTGDDIVISEGSGNSDDSGSDSGSSEITDPIFVTDKAVVKYVVEKIEEVENKFPTDYLPVIKTSECICGVTQCKYEVQPEINFSGCVNFSDVVDFSSYANFSCCTNFLTNVIFSGDALFSCAYFDSIIAKDVKINGVAAATEGYVDDTVKAVEDKIPTDYLSATKIQGGCICGIPQYKHVVDSCVEFNCSVYGKSITGEYACFDSLFKSGEEVATYEESRTLVSNALSCAKCYTDEKISALGSVMEYKGNKKYEELPTTGNETGDVYNITEDYFYYCSCVKEKIVSAGDNVVWNGSEWDVLSGAVDLTGYYDKSEVDGKLEGYLPVTTNQGRYIFNTNVKHLGFYSGDVEMMRLCGNPKVLFPVLPETYCYIPTADEELTPKKYVDDSISTLESVMTTDYATKVELQSTVDNGVLTEDIALTGGTLSGDQFSWEIAPTTGMSKLLAVVTMDADGNIVTPTYKWDKTAKKVKVTVYSTTAVSDNTYTTTITYKK